MFDEEFKISRTAKACLVSIVNPIIPGHKNEEESHYSMHELKELLRTLGIATGSEFIQAKKTVEAATIIGSGKLEEIAVKAREEGSTLLVFDFELSASQIRNIRDITGIAAIDRCHLILEIFASHAHTREAKIQIEISRLEYILPRLAGLWGHLSRQGGGLGVRGGEGEQQIELDRRMIRDRIKHYKKELESVVTSREERKKKRKDNAVTAALVGYTNAGKSSLMNRLCNENVLEEDKLFATLDSTYRTLNPDSKPPMILIDTVGFISNLPSTLIAGFKTTLESAMEADLLLIVCDISDPNFKKQLEVTQEVLKDLKVDNKEQIIIFNKRDKLTDSLPHKIFQRNIPNSFLVSSYDKEDMHKLREYVIEHFLSKQQKYDLFIPYEDGSSHSQIMSKTNIITTSNHEKGIFYRIRTPEFIFKNLNLGQYAMAPNDPRLQELLKKIN